MPADQDTDALVAMMQQQGEAEKAEILAQAQADVEQVYAQAENEIQSLAAQSQRQSEIQIAQESERVLGRAQMESRSELSAARNRLIKQAFERGGQEIAKSYNSAEHKSVLKTLIEEAIAAVGPGGCITVFDQDMELCDTIIAEKQCECSVQAQGNQPGTVIATSQNGRRRVNNSIEARLTRVEQLMKQDIARILFESGALRDQGE